MRLALDSLHSMTRWQHTAMIMRKTKRGSNLDVTTWTHVKETFYENKFTDDSAPTYRWLQFTLWFYFSFLLAGRREGAVGHCDQNWHRVKIKKEKKIQRKNCCTSVIIQSLISPREAALVSSQPNTAEPWRKYEVPIITKWTSITVVFLESLFFSVQRRTHWQRLGRMGLNRWRWMTGCHRPSLFFKTWSWGNFFFFGT